MRGHHPLMNSARRCRICSRPPTPVVQWSRRAIQISASPTAETPVDAISTSIGAATDPADARFEVLGAPYSLLSVSLSASQKLYIRRGTLVGVSGKAENAQSTLSLLEPIRRAFMGIPFLYQRISSTSPINALVSTKSPITSLAVVHLNGTVDWMVAQRKGLLAWTGHTLSISPKMSRGMSLAHWGNSRITGRGLVALAGPGQVYQITLGAGEEYIAYPGNVLAYTITQNPPLPYRFKSSNLRFQVPDLGIGYLTRDIKFFKVMRETDTGRFIGNLLFNFRTALRRTIWGDRLFLHFRGPTTILMSSRASRISDVLTTRDVNEIADAPPGAVPDAVALAAAPVDDAVSKRAADVPTGLHVATVRRDGKVQFKDTDNLDEFASKP